MLSKILFTILLSTSVVQVQALESDTSIPEEVAASYKTREQMTRDICTVLFSPSFHISTDQDGELPEELINKIRTRITEAHISGYQKAFEELSIDEMIELHKAVSDQAFQEFYTSLNNTNKDIYAQSLRDALVDHHGEGSTVIPTATYNILAKNFKAFRAAFNKYEGLIRNYAHHVVSESEKLKTVVNLLHGSSTDDLKTQLKGHMPTANDEGLDNLIKNIEDKKRDLSWNNIKDMVLKNHGHDLWDGTFSDHDWQKILAGKFNVDSVHPLDMLFVFLGASSLSETISTLPKFTEEKAIDITLKAAVARHHHLMNENDEGFQKFEAFQNEYGLTLEIINRTASQYNSPKIGDVIRSSIQEHFEEQLKQQATSEKGQACAFCGKVHQSDKSTENFEQTTPENQDDSSEEMSSFTPPSNETDSEDDDDNWSSSSDADLDTGSGSDDDTSSSSEYRPWP